MADGVTPSVEELVERNDPDGLTRRIDALCAARNWDGLLELRDRCRLAVQRGRQLWGVAAHAEYRLALEAPASWAGAVIEPGAGRFSFGPLPEVAAATHTWADLLAHVPPGPLAAVTAHERVVRGEDLRDGRGVQPGVVDLPLVLQPWEPRYPLAEYEPDGASFPAPPAPARRAWVEVDGGRAGAPADDADAVRALKELADAWVVESNGRAEAVAVRGDAPSAIGALGPSTFALREIDGATGLAHLAWAAASGGAHGRRRGMAAGRFGAWWAAAAVAGLGGEWPVEADDLGEAVADLRWFLWHAHEPATGWSLRLAVEDVDAGLAWAVAAVDQA